MDLTRIRTDTSLRERLLALADATSLDACWPWRGAKTTKKYGKFSIGGKIYQAHRISYLVFIGPVPDGLVIDHLCRNRSCINPRHMEAVSSRENTLRGYGPAGLNSKKTHCPQGHPYSDENTRILPRKGGRRCKACASIQSIEGGRRYRERLAMPH